MDLIQSTPSLNIPKPFLAISEQNLCKPSNRNRTQICSKKPHHRLNAKPQDATAEAIPKRRRGRPPKKKADPQSISQDPQKLQDKSNASVAKPKPGKKKQVDKQGASTKPNSGKDTASEWTLDPSIKKVIQSMEAEHSAAEALRAQAKAEFMAKAFSVEEDEDGTVSEMREEEETEEGDDDDEVDEKMEAVVEDEDDTWCSDDEALINGRWSLSASKYFGDVRIRNVVGEDGRMVDWLEETNNAVIKEICAEEWETYAFHPSPLIVLVFDRYVRICENWAALKELEKAFKVYWHSSNKLPPRTVKVDAKMDRDLASALKVRRTPEILFLAGHKILHRERGVQTAERLVEMIAHFYYNAKRPEWMNDSSHFFKL